MKWHMHVYKCAGSTWGGNKAVWVTLCMTFSERELIPSYNRLWGRYGKLLHRYLGCLGDHQSTGAGGDAIKRGMCVCVCVCVCACARMCQRERERWKMFFCHKCHSCRLHSRRAFSLLQKRRRIRRRSVRAVRQQKAALVFGFILSNGIDVILIKLSQTESLDADPFVLHRSKDIRQNLLRIRFLRIKLQ